MTLAEFQAAIDAFSDKVDALSVDQSGSSDGFIHAVTLELDDAAATGIGLIRSLEANAPGALTFAQMAHLSALEALARSLANAKQALGTMKCKRLELVQRGLLT